MEVGMVSKNQAPGSDWCVITSLTVSPWQGGRSEQCGDPRVQPRTVCPWRSAVPAAEEQPHVERSAAGRTVVVPGCLLGRGHCGHREQVVRAQVRQPLPSTSGDMFLNTNGQGSIPDLGEGHPKPSCRPLSELPGLELSFQVHPQTPLADGPLLTTVVAREPRAKTDSLHITPITCNALLPELCWQLPR